ncbi:unnamed protein product [Allacma fusca]|uniref:Uncharacterized protein n=1 Tax=Allacma fusca TaxID=39272 RepID=A0A8J2PX13_9HEXA|nr:unnamed protein product [Allacma fusca]
MKLILLLGIFMVLLLACPSQGQNEVTELIFNITSSWNGRSTVPENEIIEVRFYAPEHTFGVRGFGIDIKAPFYDDPAPSGNPGRFDGLWDYEVVEVFILGNDDKYVELEFGPHGHYLVYQLEGYRNTTSTTQELHGYSTVINKTEKVWHARAFIAEDQLPEGDHSFNAYAIHGVGKDRVYMALYPNLDESYTSPDFHVLEPFEPIDLTGLITSGALDSVATNHWVQFSLLFLLACKIFA